MTTAKNYAQWEDDFGLFLQLLSLKVSAGAKEYGDASFNLAPDKLFDELEAELLDICGWGFILWVRLERMRAALRDAHVKP